MGKELSWEDAEKLGKLNNNSDEIIMEQPNKYGYRVNINHPLVRPHYERYKQKIGAIVLSDKERLVFEMYIINALKRKSVQL